VARGDDNEERLIELALCTLSTFVTLVMQADRTTRARTIYQRQHANCPTGYAPLAIQQFNNSTVNYCFTASAEMKHSHWQLVIMAALITSHEIADACLVVTQWPWLWGKV
jgi:hypothetical protein